MAQIKNLVAQKRLQLRNQLFPHISDGDLWLRGKAVGFTSVPRTLPLMLHIMDLLSKGKPVSATYFELWCRMFDECFVPLKPREMAFHAGFSGQRAEQTWSERMKILQRLGFIETKPGPEGDLSYAVVLNPYQVVKRHAGEGGPVSPEVYNALLHRVSEIGAKDFDAIPEPALSPVPIQKPSTSLDRLVTQLSNQRRRG